MYCWVIFFTTHHAPRTTHHWGLLRKWGHTLHTQHFLYCAPDCNNPQIDRSSFYQSYALIIDAIGPRCRYDTNIMRYVVLLVHCTTIHAVYYIIVHYR